VSTIQLPSDARVFRKDTYFEQTGYVPHAGQQQIHYSNTRHRILSNGRRWGKTLLGGKEAETMAFVKNFLDQPMQGWIIGPEYVDCEKEFRVVYDTFKKLGIDQVSSKFLNNVESGSMRIHTKWGFDLQCRSARHPESLVGEGLDFVLIVEAGRHHRKTFTEYVRLLCLTSAVGPSCRGFLR
jgi:ribulose bisphosphate carboxylase small subunit